MSKFFSALPIFVFLISSVFAQAEDHYQILGVPRNASSDDIKKAFRRKAFETHPDRVQDLIEKKKREGEFKKINEANEVLSNPEKRREYDAGTNESFRPNDFRQNQARSAYSSQTRYVKPSEFITQTVAKMTNASVDSKIAKAVQLMDELITNPIDLWNRGVVDVRHYNGVAGILGDIWTRVGFWSDYAGENPTTSEAVCKAAFLWLKNFKRVAPEVYSYWFNYGFDYINTQYKLDLQTNIDGEWVEAKRKILDFAKFYANREWTPHDQKNSCKIF
ncbi:MAG: hypothetical protein A4S09_13040 [Proteobacteria bacterium SG_bin7]|nr:MAG: hypothetical protein A4S09_13040 [Proteobacteria bacterium SG_bin7]